jgi:hypothetical protein
MLSAKCQQTSERPVVSLLPAPAAHLAAQRDLTQIVLNWLRSS